MPSSLARFSDIRIMQAAPSLIPEALPAVTVPSFLNAGRSFARDSRLVLGRTNSSVSKTFSSLRVFIVIGTISFENFPFSIAVLAFCWLRTANSSCCSRLIANCSAIFSAVIPM